MAESDIKYRYYKRVVFPERRQKIFLKRIQTQLGLNLKEFAALAGVHVRSMTDWKREKFSISLFGLKKLCQKAGIPLPKDIKIKESFWYVNKGAKVGGLAVYRKYGRIGGDPEYRKKKWYEWWEREGRYRKHPIIGITKPVKNPRHSKKLAECVGILLGDGGLTKRQVTVTLNGLDDQDFIPYIKSLFRKLFALNPSIYEKEGETEVDIVVSRTELVQFFVNMGLCIGSKVKHQVDVPSWVKKSEKFTKFCLRGLFDTDGCFYIDNHYYKGKVYRNCAMNFTNRSLPLLFFFKTKLEQFGFHPTQNTKFSISLRRENEIINYFRVIGSSNPKHLNKFKQFFRDKYGEVPKFGHTGAVSKTAVP